MHWTSPKSALPPAGSDVFVITKLGSTASAKWDGHYWTIRLHPILYTADRDEVDLWGVFERDGDFKIPKDTLAELLAMAVNFERKADIPRETLITIATACREALQNGKVLSVCDRFWPVKPIVDEDFDDFAAQKAITTEVQVTDGIPSSKGVNAGGA
jgi:hypothetical protein